MFLSLFRLFSVLVFRTFLWGLITANFSHNNLLGGAILSAIIPIGNYKKLKLIAIPDSMKKLLLVPIQMFKETFQLMLITKPKDVFTTETINSNAQNGSDLATFVDVLVITATPMSLVTGKVNHEKWDTHTLIQGDTKQ